MSAIGYGTGAIVATYLVTEHASPMTVSAFALLFGAILVGIPFWRHVREDVRVAPARSWVMVGLAGLTASTAVSFFYLALNSAPVVVVAPIAGIYPLVAITLSYFFINRIERVTRATIIGGLLVVSGVTLVAIG